MVAGDDVTIAGYVRDINGSSFYPTGSVKISLDGGVARSVAFSREGWFEDVKFLNLAARSHSVTVSYEGDKNFETTSDTKTFTVLTACEAYGHDWSNRNGIGSITRRIRRR